MSVCVFVCADRRLFIVQRLVCGGLRSCGLVLN